MKKILIATIGIIMLSFGLVAPAMASDAKTTGSLGDQARKAVKEVGGGDSLTLGGIIEIVINTLLFIIGVISVLMIIYGGIQYSLSGTDQSKTTSAKNTIVYAVIGLIVALMAYAIVNFVLKTFLGK